MKWVNNPKVMLYVHGWLTVAWAFAIIPTLLWWRESILWVAAMSLWANLASHWACYQAVRSELKADKTEKSK